ncbi:MAG: exo-alpha-sialidase [Candidatus Thorarchaeota archaeon]|nr:exo-alpha-sialidase [Candidatus Thorarchaeota archaeon]
MARTERLCIALIAFILILSASCPAVDTSSSQNSMQMKLTPIPAQEVPLPIRYFSKNILLSTTDMIYPHHVEVTMAITEDDIMFVGWKNSETHNGGGARVSFVKSLDYGTTWSWPYDMPMFGDFNSTRQSDPWMAWHNGALYYSYLEFSEEDFTQITVAKSTDYGQSWSPVTASFGRGFADKETMLVGSDGTVYVAYDDVEDDGVTVELSKSTNEGDLFRAAGTMVEKSDGHVGPYLALSSAGDVYCAWSWFDEFGGNILLDRSLNDGETFGVEKFINQDGNFSAWTTSGGKPAKVTLPVIRFDQNDRLYVLWADMYEGLHDTFDVFLRYSDNYGLTWSPRLRINRHTDGNQWNPEFAIDSSGKLHIVYYEDRYIGGYRPFYKTLKFTGPSRDIPEFGDEMPAASAGTDLSFTRPGEYFCIKLDSDDIPHVVWTDGRTGALDIYYAYGVPDYPDYTPTTSTRTTNSTYTWTTATSTTSEGELLIVQVARWVIIIGGLATFIGLGVVYWNRRAGFG